MNSAQIAQRLLNTVRSTVARHDLATQLEVYQILVDDLEREMGNLEEAGSADDERFGHGNDDEDDDLQ